MVSVEEALERVLEGIEPLPAERVPLLQGLGRVLAQHLVAARDLPPSTNAAMDGYAFRFGALPEGWEAPARLPLRSETAGPPTPQFRTDGAVKIATGAAVPEGLDTVVPVEDTRRDGDGILLVNPPRPGANVRAAGEDVRQGELALRAGTMLEPGHLALAAGLGFSELMVRQRPRVAVLSTGNEIVGLDAHPTRDQVFDANSYGLAAQVLEAGGVPVLLGVAPDDVAAQAAALAPLSSADVLVTSGGVSMGDDDCLEAALSACGFTILVRKVAMKPGKPFLFARRDRVPAFALPGNPGAAMLAFEEFVRPTLRLLQGDPRPFRPVVEAIFEESAGAAPLKGKRREFLRCVVRREGSAFRVCRLTGRGPGMLSSVAGSNGLLIAPEGSGGILPGATVRVQLCGAGALEQSEPGLLAVREALGAM